MSEKKERTAIGAGTPQAEINNEPNEIITRAMEKVKTVYTGNNKYAGAVAPDVSAALADFCRQNEEFARAVLDGGTFGECLTAVAKEISGKRHISDLAVYQKAVEFYFPGAVIENMMIVHMSRYELDKPEAEAAQTPPKAKKSIDLSLDSLLDW